jgi:integrase
MKKKKLTVDNQRNYNTDNNLLSQEKGFFADMKVKISTREKCSVCGSNFLLTYRGMSCPKHPKVTPNHYYLDWHYLGERYRLFGFDSFKSVAIKASSIEEDIVNCKFKSEHYKGRSRAINKRFSFSECWDRWINYREKETRKSNISPQYYEKLKLAGTKFKKYFGAEDIRLIKTHRVRDFYLDLPDSNNLKTQKNIMSMLHKFLKDMYEIDEIIDELPRFPKISPQKPSVKWIEEAIQIKVLQEIPEHYKSIFIIMFDTGCRPGEARALLWNDIDLNNESIIIRNSFSGNVHRKITKGKKERILPMTEEVKKILQNHPKTLRSNFVFHTKYGETIGINCLRKVWNKACKKAGVEGITLYQGTRHSFASQLVNAGHSLEIIGSWLGHADRQTTDKYAHINLSGMKKALKKK